MSTNATDKALEAMLIQTGLRKFTDDIQAYGQRIVTRRVEKLGLTKPIAMIGYGYRVIRAKQINFKLGNETITLQPDSISVSIPL